MKRLMVVMLAGFFTFGIARASWAVAAVYVGGNVGLAVLEDSDVNDVTLDTLGVSGTKISFDNGVAATLATGVAVEAFRFEGEFSYRKNDMDELSITAPVSGSIPINGDIEAMSFLVNMYYDIKTGRDSLFHIAENGVLHPA